MKKKLSGYCSSKLYVWGDDLDPEVITDRLGITPDKAWKKGDQQYVVRSDGSIRYLDFVQRRGCWRRAIDEKRKYWDVAAQLDYWCDLLSSRDAGVRELQTYGYEMTIDCYINWGPTVLIDLPSNLLQKLGNFGIELSLGFYAQGPPPKEERGSVGEAPPGTVGDVAKKATNKGQKSRKQARR